MVAKAQINNCLYKEIGERWYNSKDYVALLRQESKIRDAWLIENLLQKKDPKNCSVLDIGCGGGFLSNALAKNHFQVTAVDLYEESLGVAKFYDSTKSVKYIQANALQLPFEKESFDVICMMDFLEHVEDFSSILNEASRVLKKNGLIYFHTFNRNWISWFFAIKCVEWFIQNTPKNLHVYHLFIKPEELLAKFRQLGFVKKEIIGMKPVLSLKTLYGVLVKGEVQEDFLFKLTPSLLMGYIGCVEKAE